MNAYRTNGNITNNSMILAWRFVIATIIAMLVSLSLPDVASATSITQPSYPVDTTVLSIRQVADDKKDGDGSSGGGHYMDIDLTGIAQSDTDGQDDNNNSQDIILENLIEMLQDAVNRVFLPLALLFCIVRLIYIIIGPLMLGLDPFDVLDFDQFREGPQMQVNQFTGPNGKTHASGRRAFNWGDRGDWRVKIPQEQISAIIKQELLGTGRMILVIMLIWTVINFLLWGSGNLLPMLQI